MSVVQRVLQKTTVRVIASELDRRAAPLEQAIRDLQARQQTLDADRAAFQTQVDSIRALKSELSAAHDRLQVRLDQSAARMNGIDDSVRAHDTDVAQLRFDLAAAQQSLADLTGVLERLTRPG